MRTLATKQTAINQYNGLGNQLWDLSGQRPTLDLRFAEDRTLVDATTGSNLVNFTRASSGTYVGSDGLIKTATTDEARFDHNPTTGESLGLLVEESRTNLLLNSATLATQNVTVTAIAHTLSFYGTGTVTLSGAHSATLVGTGAYPSRVALTFTPTAGTLTVTVSGTVEYANLEIGVGGSGVSFPTSYIPTTGSTATRAADVASISGSNFSSWFNASQGSIFSDSRIIQSATQTQVAYHFDGANYDISLRQPQVLADQFRANIGNQFTPAPGTGDALSAGTTKAAVAYSGTAGRLQVGSAGDNATMAGTLDASQLFIGSLNGATQLNGTLKRLAYWSQRLPNEVLQAITT